MALAANRMSPWLRRGEGEGDERRFQAEGADHDVGVHMQHPQQAMRGRRDAAPSTPRQQARNQKQAAAGRQHFGSQSGARHAGNSPAQHQHEDNGEHDVDPVERHLQEQRHAGAPGAQQPAQDRVIGKGGRRAPDPHVEIGAGIALHRRAALHEAQREKMDRRLQDDEQQTDARRPCQRAQEYRAQFHPVVGAQRLGRQARRSHAQEAEAPEDEIEDQRAQRHAADQRRIGQTADDAGIDGAQQRRGDVGEDDRSGQPPDPAVVTGPRLSAGVYRPWAYPCIPRGLAPAFSMPSPRATAVSRPWVQGPVSSSRWPLRRRARRIFPATVLGGQARRLPGARPERARHMVVVEHRRVDGFLQIHAVMNMAQEEHQFPLLLLVTARRAERQIGLAFAQREIRRQRGARPLARRQASRQAGLEPEHLGAVSEAEAQSRE